MHLPALKKTKYLFYNIFITALFVGTATHTYIRPNMTQGNIWLGKICIWIKSMRLKTKLLDVSLCGVEVTPKGVEMCVVTGHII